MSKQHKVERFIASKINNIPALITQTELENIVSYLEDRESPTLAIGSEETKRRQAVMTDDIAMIPIMGSLSYEKTWLGAMCGMSSYQSLLEDVEKALDLGIKTIVFDANSGGGEAYSMFSTANAIRKRVDGVGGKIITYVDGMCASACFGLAAVSDEIILHPDAKIGSVGVVVRLVNGSEREKKEGYETTYITSAKSKVPFDEGGKWKSDFLTDIQNDVNELHTKFATHIAENRNMSLDNVNETEAKVFTPEKALEIGFADKIMDQDQFFEYLEELQEGNMPLTFNKDKTFNMSKQEDEMKLEEMQAKLEATEKSNADLEAKLKEFEAGSAEANAKLESEKAALEAQVAEMQEAEVTRKLSSRKEALSAVLADDKVEAVFEATKELPDAAFNTVLNTYEQKNEQLESSELFTEQGVDAGGSETPTANSTVMSLIKSKKAK